MVSPHLAFLSCFTPYTPAWSLRSAGQLLLEVPESRWKLTADRTFSIVAPKLWNNLPLHLRWTPSLSFLKPVLKPIFTSWPLTQCETKNLLDALII